MVRKFFDIILGHKFVVALFMTFMGIGLTHADNPRYMWWIDTAVIYLLISYMYLSSENCGYQRKVREQREKRENHVE